VDVKVIAATDQDLEQAIERGTFRKPLYFRFGQKLRLPPLRQRAEEIPLLAHYFLDKYARQSGSRARSISHRAIQQLMAYHWPGNVRELENNVASAVSRNREVLFSWDFECQRSSDTAGWGRLRDSAGEAKQPVVRTMDEIEKQHILEALEATRGNITRSAELLGYKSRQTMLNKMARYGIPRNYGDAPRLRSAGSNISQG
jgi:Nif-specific regulatory protein